MTRVTDRSRTETYYHCPAKRYLQYSYEGLGIVPELMSDDANFGLAIHRALAKGLSSTSKPDDLLAEMVLELSPENMTIQGNTPDGEPLYLEYFSLGFGFCYTFVTRFRDHLLSIYDLVSVEHEIVLPLTNDLLWMARLDGALRRKSDGMLYVLEWKTTSYADTLAYQYEYSLQTAMEMASLQHALGEYVGGMLLIGIDKGRKSPVGKKEEAAGLKGSRRLHPFTYLYQRDNGFDTDYSVDWKRDWARVPVWVAMPLTKWMAWLEKNAPEVFNPIFMTPFPLHIRPQQIAQIKQEIIRIENLIVQSDYVPLRHYTNCHQDSGIMNKPCPYIGPCHNNEYDGYVTRVPHHPLELSNG